MTSRAATCLITALLLSGSATAAEPDVPSFRNEVMAVLSKAGCNQGTCHGNANGKGGLKISLRGEDPAGDFFTLTRKSAARRVTPLNPDASLLLQKPTMTVPHEGGRRFEIDSREYRILKDWIAAGSPKDSEDVPTLSAIQVSPAEQTIESIPAQVQLSVQATFDDGSVRDVTHLAVFESSATFVTCSPTGLISSDEPGLTSVTVRYLHLQQPVRLEFVSPRPDFQFADIQAANAIDKAVFDQLRRLKLQPAGLCDDATFVRRLYLDLTGLLPTRQQAESFLASDDPNRRSKLIDQLLASTEFVDMQTLRWADLLRVEEKTIDQKGLQVYHDWIRQSIADNKPLNVLAAELLGARGSTYKVAATNFYRALRKPEQRAEATAQVFLGVRLQCAKCHNHPFDRWTQDDYYSWSNYFARIDYKIIENKRRDKNDKNEFVGEQIVQVKDKGDVKNPSTGQTAGLRFLGDRIADAQTTPIEALAEVPYLAELFHSDDENAPNPDRLQQLAAWISHPSNSRFATTQANRIWAQLMGRGIIDPVDDFRSTNPPSNPELLKVLTAEFVEQNFDVRHLMKLITNSKTYQMASVTSADENLPNSDDRWDGCFARSKVQRMTAEQTLDAICQVVGVSAKFGGHETGTKAVQLKGVRNGGHRHSPPEIGDRFLKLFGKPSRLQTCECERTNKPTLAQTFELISGDLVSELMQRRGNRLERLMAAGHSDGDIVTDFYWTALSRPPTKTEQTAAVEFIESRDDRQQALEDFVWALLNSNEFLLRH